MPHGDWLGVAPYWGDLVCLLLAFSEEVQEPVFVGFEDIQAVEFSFEIHGFGFVCGCGCEESFYSVSVVVVQLG